jgi:CRP/FNR family transcriptional regulator, cyclic AMP receptor protein
MSASVEETAALLAQVGVFSQLGRAELEQVAEVAVPRSFHAGEVVFREGDESNTSYIVRDGHARAVRQHSDGRTLTLANFGPGEVFGELAMFDSDRRSATIEAIDDLHLLAILGADMQRLMREHPDIAVKLVITLGRRLRELNDRLTRQSFQTVQSRVATVLSELVRAAQSEGAGESDVLVTATQAEVAQLAGSSRESASRFLATLERAGVISQGRGKLTVHQPGALQRYVF